MACAAHGARGYPGRPASDADLDAKFSGCARRVLPAASADRALAVLRRLDELDDVRRLTDLLCRT
jgi:hypothetical protein